MSGAQNRSTTGLERRPRGPYRTRILAGIVAAGLVIAGTVTTVSPAAAASAPSCSQAAAVVTCTVTFSYTGSEQPFVVPAGIGSISALAIGGHGGAHSRAGGLGASTSGSFAVSAGQTLFVEVAGAGSNWVPGGGAPGGFNGGGYANPMIGSNYDLGGGGGGGASDVRTLASTAPGTLASRLVVAAGGAGGGYEGLGGNAGSAGGASTYSSAGGAGTATAGGAGGTGAAGYGPTAFGIAGTLGVGGASAPSSASGGGGGGGGGLYGGGGGGTYGGGGGGSSLGTTGGVSSAAASVTLAYSPTVSSITIGSSSGSVTAGGTAALSAIGSDDASDTWNATASTTFSSSDGSDRVTGSSIRFGTAGPRTISGVDNAASSTTAVTVTIGPASTITIARSASSVVAGGTATFTASAQDAGGDQLGDVTGSTTFTSSNASDQATGGSIRFGKSGTRTITAQEATFTDATTIAVTVGPQVRLTVTPSSATAVAGDTLTLTATSQDAGGDELGDLTSRSTFTSSNSSDRLTGNRITVGTAGTRTITGVRGAFSGTTTIGVSVGPVASLVISPSQGLAVAGETRTFSVEGFDVSGDDLGDVTTDTTFTSTDASDAIDGAQVVFGVSGPRTLTATDGQASENTDVSVTVGAVASLTVTASRTSVAAGESATFSVEGFDISGDDLGDVTADTTFSSSDASDQVTGTSVTFGLAGARSIGAADGDARGETSVTVVTGGLHSIVVTSSASSVDAGGSATITAEGFDVAGNDLGDITSDSTFSSSNGSDEVTDNTIDFGTLGSRTITATDGEVSGTVDVMVMAGPLMYLDLTAAPTYAAAGDSAIFTARGLDSVGDDLGDVTQDTTFTSGDDGDVVTGSSILFTHPGTHIITATDGAATGSMRFTVTVGTIASVVIDPASTSVIAGASQAFTAVGYDAQHNPLGDVTAITTFTSTESADTVTGNSIRFTTAGSDTVTATVGAASATANVAVAADAANPASITLHASDSHVLLGGSVTLRVTGADAYGNSIPGLTERTGFTSDWAVDVIHGSTVTFPHASIHHITATLGAVNSTVAVTVTAPASVVVAYTGTDPTLPFTAALAMLLCGLVAYFVSARRRGARSFSKSSRNLR